MITQLPFTHLPRYHFDPEHFRLLRQYREQGLCSTVTIASYIRESDHPDADAVADTYEPYHRRLGLYRARRS